MSKDYTFNNVTITIDAESATDAYKQLCALLSSKENVGYATDTYSEEGDEEEKDCADFDPSWDLPPSA